MRFVFDGKYQPLGEYWGFIKTDIESAKNILESWLKQILIDDNNSLKLNEIKGNLENIFQEILPYKYPPKVALIQCNNDWIGLTKNFGDASWINQISRRIENSYDIKVWACSKYIGKTVNGWGGGYLRLDVGEKESVRSMMLSLQDKGWEFDNHGEYLPFEEVEKYNEKLARNRFTPEMLDRYLKHYGIDFFNEEFYMPPGSKAYIIEIVRPPYPNEVSETLEEVRKKLRYE